MRGVRPASILMEAVIVLPVLVMLIFAVIQFANILMVQQLVEYAAYCGARATLTCNAALATGKATRAALRVLAPVSLSEEDDDSDTGPHDYPGWGKLKGTKDLEDQVEVELMPPPIVAADTVKYVGCKVTFKYPLLIPIPSYRTTNGVIRLEGKAVLPFRYSTLKYPFGLDL